MSAPAIKLNDGNSMPQLGLGVWQASDAEARAAVRHAIESGYRSIDTASIYRNETGVGQGVRDSGVDRSSLFLTTKIWNSEQGASTPQALQDSLRRLDTDYVDLLLIHWPAARRGRYLETWKQMIRLKEKGLARSIGVSNFQPDHLRHLIAETKVTPALNQVELHPYLQQHPLRELHAKLGIATESWSPLAQSQALRDPALMGIAEKHGKTPAQVVLRWHLDSGLIVIPKSVTPSRIEGNFDVFDFQLGSEDLAVIASLDRGFRIGPNPDTFD